MSQQHHTGQEEGAFIPTTLATSSSAKSHYSAPPKANRLATAEVQADTVYCQTVTSTGTICPTFVQMACLALSTISSQCGCPSTVPTKSVDYPCGGNPPRGCMGTSYIYETATPTCGGVTFTTEAVPTIAPTPTPTTAGLEACPTVYTTEIFAIAQRQYPPSPLRDLQVISSNEGARYQNIPAGMHCLDFDALK
ncbi:uncharacterized protein CLUP02_07042 [Colletotrichum lupini]|uniref:Uncharacterized protein n=1 Tax=Colletotrichum lupini TaxID=145971 RepID=A0A9Q8SQD4_9PEZI|nr:uncharacterized protein CLUP02_07042 [Colletotrichum lupini]UQC81556.1 hypothetical protein CLUP02_07042 [Colletotrichum lupini]